MGRLTLLIFTVVLALTFTVGNAKSIRSRRQVGIPPEFANIKIENYLKNPRAMRFQLKCLTDEGPCDRIGKYLKAAIPQLLTTTCKNCDAVPKDVAGKIVAYIQQNYKKEWAAVLNKYRGQVSDDEIKKFEADYGISITNLTINGTVASAPVSVDELKGIFDELKAHPPKVELNKPLPWAKDIAAFQASQNKTDAATAGATAAQRTAGRTGAAQVVNSAAAEPAEVSVPTETAATTVEASPVVESAPPATAPETSASTPTAT